MMFELKYNTPFEWTEVTRAMYIFFAASGSLSASVPQIIDA